MIITYMMSRHCEEASPTARCAKALERREQSSSFSGLPRSRWSLAMTMCVFLLSGCGVSLESADESLKEDFMRPMNLWEPLPIGLQYDPPPGGTPEFNQGWHDGCYSGIAAYGGDTYKYGGYKFKQDWRMIKNPEYYRTWQDSYLYCRWYLWNYIQHPPGVTGQWLF